MEEYLKIFLTLIISFLLIYLVFLKRNIFDRHGVPNPKPLPIFGNTLKLMLRQTTFIDHMKKIYTLNEDAKYAGFYDLSNPVLMIRDLDLIKSITIKNFDHFMNHRGFTDPENEPLFGNNLFSLRDEKWRDIRTLLSPAFTSMKMKSMFKLMSDCAENFTNYIAEETSVKPLDYNSKDIFTRYTNDTIASCAFGISVDSMKDRDNPFYVLGRQSANFEGIRAFKFFITRSFPLLSKIFKIKLIDDHVDEFFQKLVKDTIETREKNNIIRPDMIQLMMEARKTKADLTIPKMTSQAFIFFFGGFDTTSTLMCFIAHEISTNPHIYEKLVKEVDQVFGQYNGEPTYEAVTSMEYLDAVINEALRLYPVAPFLDRICTKDYELPPTLPGSKEYFIKAGSHQIWIPVTHIQRDPKYFPDPEMFKPERFLPENKADFNAAAYLPFGSGPRICIGMRFALLETKVLFVHLLHKCLIKPGKKMILPMKLSKSSFIISAEGGFWLEFQPRK